MNIIISPSGNLYGSEQVLLDYLSFTSLIFRVYVPEKSLLQSKLIDLKSKHRISTFHPANPKFLYVKVGWWLMTGKAKSVYSNEAGHSKYIFWLAKLFSKVSFFIHVRILEDTYPQRWPSNVLKNVKVFTISRFIQSRLHYPSLLIYDAYPFRIHHLKAELLPNMPLKVGIAGRLTRSKGIHHLLPLLAKLDTIANQDFRFLLFGTYDVNGPERDTIEALKNRPDVIFKGFVQPVDKIYNEIDCLVHLAEEEPLGRIFFEALDYQVPFIGFNSGGIAELASMVDCKELLVDPTQKVYDQLSTRLIWVNTNYKEMVEKLKEKKEKAISLFQVNQYASLMDQYFTA